MKKCKRVLTFIFILTLCLQGAFSSPLLSYKIANASYNELVEMAKIRGLENVEDEEKLREALYKAENIVIDNTTVNENTKGYTLEILHSDSSLALQNGSVELIGNIELSFKDGKDEKLLTCDRLLFDANNKKITAFDNVVFKDKNKANSKLGDVEADIVTFFYENEDLIISGGTTETERTNNEDEKVTFYTSGELLTFKAKDGGLVFKDGFISSDVENRYSSISADTLALLDGGDMFLKGATLRLGRVPIIYMPIFFYPGSTLSCNPAFGFNSSRGMFLSTTWEIFGKNKELEKDNDSSSFSALLRSNEDGKMVSNGLYYEALKDGETLSGVESWAENSNSYFSILADVYQNAGLFIGYDGSFNTSSNTLKTESHSGLALTNSGYGYKGKVRYYSTNNLKLNTDYLNITLDFPFYSDPTALRDYKNRLTSFAFTSIFGEEQEFPTTYNSTFTSYKVKASGDISLPRKFSTPYLKTLNISDLNITVENKWDSYNLSYYMERVILPSLRFSASGSIFELGSQYEKRGNEEKNGESETEKFILEDPLLRPLYEKSFSKSSYSEKGSYLNLGYSLSSNFFNEFEKENARDKKAENELGSDNKIVLTLDGGYKEYFLFKEVITPIVNIKSVKDKSKSFDTSLLSNFHLSSPFLGLEYNLNNRLYRKQINVIKDVYTEKEMGWFSFNKESVSAHNISIKRDFKIDKCVLTPKLSYILPPLKASLLPSVSFSGYGFISSFSWSFSGDNYQSDKINFSLGFNGKNFLFSMGVVYDDSKNNIKSVFEPLSLSFSTTVQNDDKKYSISESGKFKGDGSGFSTLKTVVKIPTLTLGLDFKSIDKNLKLNYLSIDHNVNNELFTFWKNRVGVAFSLNNKFHYDFNNKYNSYLTFSPSLIFKIQEFLQLKISYTMRNDSFYKYESFNDLWNDLLSSFDFAGNGRRQTSFIMNSMAFELVHYMQDWDFTLRYNADVVYQNNFYQWVPSISVFLKWKTMPDLKVDENWRYINDNWISSGPMEM